MGLPGTREACSNPREISGQPSWCWKKERNENENGS